MLKSESKYSLEGSFRVKTFDADNNLIEDTDEFSNFITASGLRYPSIYSFADCFRFLTLGQGTAQNSHTGNVGLGRNPTTGVQDYVNSNGQITLSDGTFQSTISLGRQSYFGGTNAGCGTIVTNAGNIMYRAWSVPSGNKLTSTAISINEFMVSPSSGNDPSGNIAFSRVVRSVIIPANSRSIISYQLAMRLQNTGATPFASIIQTGSANVDEDLSLIREWQNLSGYFRQITPGLRYVDIQGSTYVPKYGDCFEPSKVDVTKLVTYFSPDNSAFDVSATGANQQSESSAYAANGLSKVYFGQNLALDAGRTSEGNAQYYAQGDLTTTSYPTSDANDLPTNIRYKTVAVPDISNYRLSVASVDYSTATNDHLTKATPISIATPGATGYNTELLDLGDKTVFSSLTVNLPYTYSGFRTQRLTRKQFFCPVNSLGHNARFGSFVIGFQNGSSYYPYIDALLYDNSGRAQMQHIRKFSGVAFSDYGSGNPVGYIKSNIGLGLWSGLLQSSSGVVTGFQGGGAQDIGIVDHSLTANSAPSASGSIWFPHVNNGNVMQTQVPNCVYAHSGLTITDSNNYFANGGQMINNLVFRPVASGDYTTDKSYGWASRFPNQDPSLSGAGDTYWNGLYLTRASYTGEDAIASSSINEDNFKVDIGLASSRYTNLRITGYIGERNDITSKCIAGTITLSSLPTTYLTTFTPDAKSVNMTYYTAASGNLITQGYRIQDIFSGVSLANRLSGSGFTYDSGSRLSFGITGVVLDTDTSTWIPVRVSSLSGNYLLSPGYQWIGHSFHSGEVLMTRFKPPTGKLLHEESFRLLPNYAYPTGTANSYPTVNFGGTYPALSFNNTLEIFQDLMWSASCGTALDCVEP